MKNKIITLFFILLSFITVLCSCSDPLESKVNGDFLYNGVQDSMNKPCVTIIGLSEKGQQKETIVIPTKLNGNLVKAFGKSFAYRNAGRIESENLKNLYIHNQIERVIVNDYFCKLRNVKVYCGYDSEKLDILGYHFSLCGTIYVSKEECDKYIGPIEEEDELNNRIIYANVIYYLNYDRKTTFFVDDCDGTVVNVIPPDPTRKGYLFKGWYKEQECINQWDFENDIVPLKEYDENGKYVLKETKIYAKWENEK